MLKRVMPVLILLFILGAFFVFDLGHFLSFDTLTEHRVNLLTWVDTHAILAPMAFILAYIVVVTFSLPAGMLMTLTGGFLFGALAGGIYTVIGATIGATLLFLIAKTSVGDYLLSKAGDGVQKLQQGFAEDALSYMFVLRLLPVVPFVVANLAPAFFGVPLRIYVTATFFGIMPATFVYALVGSGLGSVFDQGQEVTLTGVLTPEVLAGLLGLALLAVMPVAYKRFVKKEISKESLSEQ